MRWFVLFKDVYNDVGERRKFLDRYYTEKGVMALETRLRSLVEIREKFGGDSSNFPLVARMLGFPALKIKDVGVLDGMIDNLCQILAIKNVVVGVNDDECEK